MIEFLGLEGGAKEDLIKIVINYVLLKIEIINNYLP